VKRHLSIIGAPVWLGQPHYGTQFGPDALRSAGLTQLLQSLYNKVIDLGNIHIPQNPTTLATTNPCLRHLGQVRSSSELLAEKVSATVLSGSFPLVLGGDHSIALGSLSGIAKHYKNLGVIWYDAHADINTPETSPSGNIHGMPLAASMGLGHKSLTQLSGYFPKVKPENIVIIGARDIDPGEIALIKEKNIKVFTSQEMLKRGASTVMKEAISYLKPKCDGIHLSFDLDVIDPKEAPGVGTPVAHGLEFSRVLESFELLFQHKIITSADFVEINPLLDQDNETVALTLELIQMLLGGKAVCPAIFGSDTKDQKLYSA